MELFVNKNETHDQNEFENRNAILYQNEDLIRNESNLLLTRFVDSNGALIPDENGILLVPILTKGILRLPKKINKNVLESLFKNEVRGDHQVIKKIDGAIVMRSQCRDRIIYSIFPECKVEDIIVDSEASDWRNLINLPYEEVLGFVNTLREALLLESSIVEKIAIGSNELSDLAEYWNLAGFQSLSEILDPIKVAEMVENELAQKNLKGRDLLDHWNELKDSPVAPAPINILANMVFSSDEYTWAPRNPQIRALPTRQLHITAGNSPQIPLISLIRGIAVKAAITLKLPSGACVGGSLIATLANLYLPNHAITKLMSVVYWPGGDEQFERSLFNPLNFDRVVVWGSPQSVESIKNKFPFTKVISLNPRFGMSLIGRDAIIDAKSRHQVAVKMVCDSLVANQKACIASLVHYVEANAEDLYALAKDIKQVLSRVDEVSPNKQTRLTLGELQRLKRGSLIGCEWFENFDSEGIFCSGVVIADQEVNLAKHPANRLLILRPVQRIESALKFMSAATSTVSVFPESTRMNLRDRISAKGVSQVVPLGESGSFFIGMSHDGMRILSELVEWKNA